MFRTCLTFIIIFAANTVAFAGFDFNQNCKRAYTHIMSWQPEKAKQLLKQEILQNPGNKIPLYLEHYIVFLELIVNEDKAAYANYRRERDQRIRAISRDAEESPWKRFTQAEIYLQSSFIRLKFGEFMPAATDAQRAYRLLEENQKLYPDFILNQKSLLPLQAALGVIPENYRWMTRVLGLQGNLQESAANFESLIKELNKHPDFRVFSYESKIILSYINLYLLNDGIKAWQVVSDATSDFALNPLSAFFGGNMALRLKKINQAALILKSHVQDDPPIPHLDYMMGTVLLYRLDDESRKYLARYLKNFKGESYRKDAFLKIGWAYAIKGDRENFDRCSILVRQIGNTTREEDRQALDEINLHGFPHMEILRARLQFDGGFQKNALDILLAVDKEKLSDAHRLEYHYRLGRVYHEMRNLNQALLQYGLAHDFSMQDRNYFVPAAHYYSGVIYEQQGNTALATEHFRKTLSFTDYAYKNSFDQRSNAGLRRVGGN